jgi:tRNA nucleotidyltransferase (CCA-adding enzyme)
LSDVLTLDPPSAVRRIAHRLEEAGFETWAVGGAVRDRVLGRPAGDWDLATRARPPQVRKLFRKTVPLGIEHGTVGVIEGGKLYEVTTFRRDVETFGRHAVVEFADRIEDDLARRDFTINALAWHPPSGRLFDPFQGRRDLEARTLRTVGNPADRFAEDYLRVLRALRFAGHFDLAIDPPTWEALKEATPYLGQLSAERVREELVKVLSQIRPASRSLDLYQSSGALAELFPELHALVGERPAPGQDDLWTTTLRAVDALPTSRPTLRLAALLHAVGMPPARTRDLRGGWRYTGHEVLGARKAEDVMRRLKASNAETERVTRLVRHQRDLYPPDAPGAGVRRWLRDVGVDLVNDLFRLRFALWRAENPGGGRPDDLLERVAMARRAVRSRPALSTSDLALTGHDLRKLGLPPGPRFGEILNDLLERVIDDPALNERTTLEAIVREEWLHE